MKDYSYRLVCHQDQIVEEMLSDLADGLEAEIEFCQVQFDDISLGKIYIDVTAKYGVHEFDLRIIYQEGSFRIYDWFFGTPDYRQDEHFLKMKTKLESGDY